MQLSSAKTLLQNTDLSQAVLIATEIVTKTNQTVTREIYPGPALLAQAFQANSSGEAFVKQTWDQLRESVKKEQMPSQDWEIVQSMPSEDLSVDVMELIADAALKELARDSCVLLQNSAFNDPDLLEDLRSISSMEMPDAVYRGMAQVVQAKQKSAMQDKSNRQKTPRQGQGVNKLVVTKKTDKFLSQTSVREHFEDCMEGLQEIQILIHRRFDDPDEADRVFENGLEKAFAASAKTMDAKNRLQKVQNVQTVRHAQ